MKSLVIREELRVKVLVLHNEKSKLNSASDQDASLRPPSWGSEERFCLLACLETPQCPPEELEVKDFCLINKPLVNLAMCLSAKGWREGSWGICATQTWIRKWKDEWRKQKLWLKQVSICRYITSIETGSQPVTDIFHFVVYDGDNNRLDNQICTITITSTPRQPPVVTVRGSIKVCTHYVLHTDVQVRILHT